MAEQEQLTPEEIAEVRALLKQRGVDAKQSATVKKTLTNAELAHAFIAYIKGQGLDIYTIPNTNRSSYGEFICIVPHGQVGENTW